MKQSKKTQIEAEVSNRVRAFREKKGYTQEALAEVLGVSKGFIGQIESPSSASTYNLNHLNLLAKEFECSPRDFLPEKPL